MNIMEKYPLAYTQRFNLIDSKIEALQEAIGQGISTANYIDIAEDESTGIVTISLLNAEEEVISQKTITITGKLIKSSVIDLEEKAIIFTCLDSSEIVCDISDLLNILDAFDERITTLERLQVAMTYAEAMSILEAE